MFRAPSGLPSKRPLAFVLIVAAGLPLAACSSAGTTPRSQTPVVVAQVAEASEEQPPVARPAEPGASQCRAELRVSRIEKATECYTDLPREGTSGAIEMDCSDGPVRVELDGHEYTGRVRAGQLEMTRVARFPFSDGCEWESSQTIRASSPEQLVIQYTEQPVAGEDCAAPCTATAYIDVSRPTSDQAPGAKPVSAPR